MKRKLILLFLVFLAVVLASCAAPGTGTDNQSGGSATAAGDGASGGNTGTSWSSDIPSDFPQFNYGTFVVSQSDSENEWYLTYGDVTDDNIADYKQLLENNGWQLSESLGDTSFYVKGENSLDLLVGKQDSDGKHIVSIYLETGGNQDGGDDAASTPAADGNADSTPAADGNADSGLSVPSDYPAGSVPLYDQSKTTVIGSVKQNAADTLIYHLVLGANEDVAAIGKSIGSTLEAQSKASNGSFQQVLAGNEYMFIGNVSGWDYTVVVGDGSADGYTTIITYQVSEKQ